MDSGAASIEQSIGAAPPWRRKRGDRAWRGGSGRTGPGTSPTASSAGGSYMALICG